MTDLLEKWALVTAVILGAACGAGARQSLAAAPPASGGTALGKAQDVVTEATQVVSHASVPRFAEFVSCSPEGTLEGRPGILGSWPSGTSVLLLSRIDNRSLSTTTLTQRGTRTAVWGDCTMLAAAPDGDAGSWLGMVGAAPGAPYRLHQPEQVEASRLARLAEQISRTGELDKAASAFQGAQLPKSTLGAAAPLSASTFTTPGGVLTAVRFPIEVQGLPDTVPGPVVLLLDGAMRLVSGPCSTDPFAFTLGGRTYLFVVEQACATGYGMRRLFVVGSGQVELQQETAEGSL